MKFGWLRAQGSRSSSPPENSTRPFRKGRGNLESTSRQTAADPIRTVLNFPSERTVTPVTGDPCDRWPLEEYFRPRGLIERKFQLSTSFN